MRKTIYCILITGLVLGILAVAPRLVHAQVPGSPSPCIKDPVQFGDIKRLLPLASECSATDTTEGQYCGRGARNGGEYGSKNGCYTPTYIVMHTTQGITNVDSLYSFFGSGGGGNGTGSHFGIGSDGRIIQMVEMGKTQVEFAQAVGGIPDHISIEMASTEDHTNYSSKQDMINTTSQAEYDSALKLVKALMQQYNLPLSNVVSHEEMGGGGGDPGQGWMADFRADLPNATPLDSSTGGTASNSGSASSTSCVVTKVGNPKDPPPPLPANCSTSQGGNSSGSSVGGGSSNYTGNFIYYCQGDPRWANSCDLGDAGCGPTSLAMIMSSLGVTVTPPQVDSVFQSSGWRAGCGAGSDIYSAITSSWFKSQGFQLGPNLIAGDKPDLGKIQTYLNQGYLIILNAFNYPCKGCINQFTPVGHILVVDGVDVAGNRMHTRDPNNCSWATGQENNSPSLAWTDFDVPVSEGGGAGSSYNAAYPIKR